MLEEEKENEIREETITGFRNVSMPNTGIEWTSNIGTTGYTFLQ